LAGLQACVTAFTHRGRVRAGNEDVIVIGDWVSEPEMAQPRQFRHALTEPLVCAVADGMGGHRAGEVASGEAARRLSAAGARLTDAPGAAAALHQINASLYRAMEADPRLLGMGTTVVGMALSSRIVWFNVGDSRLYRVAGGLTQLSTDDVPPGPRNGTITQTLGGLWPPGASIAPHVGDEPLNAPARYLLCSDGVTDMLDDAEVAACLAFPDADAVARLFEAAMHAGGMDNISIILVSVE
jgi:serine/threonine protein phosphatase PrpC